MPMERSHIWLGTFLSEHALDQYFEENFDDDNDAAPINRFAADQGETFIDHDRVERSFLQTDNLRLLIRDHSYSEDYLEDVIRVAEANAYAEVNTFVMADEGEIAAPKSIDQSDYKLWYLGVFTCSI